MLAVTFRPIVKWPGKSTKVRTASRFRVTYGATLDLLDRELYYLLGKHIVVELALGERDIRNDGLPRAGAHPSHPGVILSFESKHGPLRYPCDTYTRWEDNLRAIALALQALRAVDRYGVTRIGEQYTGWKQLPGPLLTPPAMTVEEAAEFLTDGAGGWSVQVTTDYACYRETYRQLAARLHPDSPNGDAAAFKRLQEARAVLDAHFAKEGTPCNTDPG